MSKKRSVLTFIAALTLYALTMPISAFATTTIPVGSGAEFSQAAQTVRTAADNEYIIELTDDIEAGSVTFRSPSHVSVSIVGNEHTVTLKNGSLISVMRGAQLNLGSADGSDRLKISGGGDRCYNLPGMLYIQDNSTCNMYSGVTIADRIGHNYFGGGVTVQGGTFHMYGGIIEKCGLIDSSNCSGGGVAVINGGLFTMDGGEIKNCFVTSNYTDLNHGIITTAGGGVFVSGGSSFVMTGGTIRENKADEMGGGVAVVATQYDRDGDFKSSAQILGGKIIENEASVGAGVLASSYFYIQAWGMCAPTPGVGTPPIRA